MARRRPLSQQQAAAYARRAVDQIAAADDVDAAARSALSEAADGGLRRAIVETSAGAPDRVTAALVGAALQEGTPQLADVAADLLVDLAGGPYGLGVLRQCFASEEASVRRRAVEAVEGFGDPAVVALLADGLTDEEPTVRRAAAVTFGLIVGTPHHPLRRGVLNELSDPQSGISRAITENPDDQVRRQAPQGLSFSDSDAALPTVARLCEDGDEEVRVEAVLCLAAVGSAAALELLAKRLDDASYRVASSALDMLAAHFGSSSLKLLPMLEKVMAHPLPDVRRQAVLMLDRFELSQVRAMLEKGVEDADFEVARRAGEMLRRYGADTGLGWLAEEISETLAGDRALAVWEAGNIGMEQGGAARSGEAGMDALVRTLEVALRSGSASDKVHALNELSGLADIADSEAMRDALDDDDSSVRSRAADALTRTRDAGLLAKVLQTHADHLVRRRAADALAENPGGSKPFGRRGQEVAFSSTRTLGMCLFSSFMGALDDPDTEVRQRACDAIRDYAQRTRLLPVRQTLRELEGLAADGSVSFLMQEGAEDAAGVVSQNSIATLIAEQVDEILAWRGQLAREAHAVRWDEGSGGYTLADLPDEETVERWRTAYRLSEEQAAALARAGRGTAEMDEATAGRILGGLTRDLSAALSSVAHAARALGLIGHEDTKAVLDQSARSVHAAPRLEWGPRERVARWLQRLQRSRSRAEVDILRAKGAFEPGSSAEDLGRMAGAEDGWVRLMALAASAELDPERSDVLQPMAALCEEHLGDKGYVKPLGRAAVVLLRAAFADAVRFAEFALAEGNVDFRAELTERLLAAAQAEECAEILRNHVAGKTAGDLPAVCLALALRGAGHAVERFDPSPDVGADDRSELACARLALRIMDNDPDAAVQLANVVRNGSAEQQYRSANYLSLSRARSSVPVFASVRDRDGPYMLRALCAGSLLRRGHPGGPAWFEEALSSASGGAKAGLLIHLSRAVEDTVPAMLECNDVNVGRFV